MKLKYPYPFIPEGKAILYVPSNNPFILAAKDYARKYSLDSVMPTGAILVRDGEIIGLGTNGSDYHEKNGCERIKQGVPTGQQYELCDGCSPKNHAEPRAINDALSRGNDISDSDLYLWGHYWCCDPCWKVMINAGVGRVFLMENSEVLFNKNDPKNIVGKQFE